jgi:flagellar hook protein FlgE
MFFDKALSGVNASANILNIAGNNVANANTIGFKGANANFSAMLNGSTSASTGTQNFSQGVISASQNSSDLAINGAGFFRTIDTNGGVTYTRNGQFALNSAGNLVNANGEKLTDVGGAAINIASNTSIPGTPTTTISASQYLSPSLIPITGTFNASDSATYSASNTATVYDTAGNAQNLQVYYVNRGGMGTATTYTYDVYTKLQSSSSSALAGSIQVDPATGLIAAGKPNTLTGISIGAGTTAALNLTGIQQNNNTATNSLTANGQQAGFMSGFNIESDGSITMMFSNKQTLTSAQRVGLVSFASPTGLQATGKNSWVETSASGPAIAGSPNANGLGAIQSSALEGSNVDMTSQLIDLLAAQRAYQANSQVIKAQDAVLQTMVNLN